MKHSGKHLLSDHPNVMPRKETFVQKDCTQGGHFPEEGSDPDPQGETEEISGSLHEIGNSLRHQTDSLGDNQYVVEGNSNQIFLLDTPVLDVEYCPQGCHFPEEGSGLDPQGETEEIGLVSGSLH